MMSRLTAALATSALALGLPLGLLSTIGLSPANAGGEQSADRVTLSSSAETVHQGDKVRLEGTAAPRATSVGRVVSIQAQYEGRGPWKTVAKTKVRTSGTFAFVDKISTDRTRNYRAILTEANRVTPSNSLWVGVYAWRPVGIDFPLSMNKGLQDELNPQIDGAQFTTGINLVQTALTGMREVTVARRCEKIRFTAGLLDSSPSETTGKVSINADGRSVYTREFAVGSKQLVTLDMTDVFRFSMTLSVPAFIATAPAGPTVADLEGLCVPTKQS